MVGNSFCYNLIKHVALAYRVKVFCFFWVFYFGNEGNECVVKVCWYGTRIKDRE